MTLWWSGPGMDVMVEMPEAIVVRYWFPHPCGGYYLHAAHYWTAAGRGGYAP